MESFRPGRMSSPTGARSLLLLHGFITRMIFTLEIIVQTIYHRFSYRVSALSVAGGGEYMVSGEDYSHLKPCDGIGHEPKMGNMSIKGVEVTGVTTTPAIEMVSSALVKGS
jgi:hypothetical protein